MSLKDDTLLIALMGGLSNIVKEANDSKRKELLGKLLNQYEQTGNKTYSVKNLEGDKVATITLSEPKAETVVSDTDAFISWCRDNRPELLETVHHPRQVVESWDEVVLKPTALADVLEDVQLAGTDYITPEGEPVDGIEFKPAPAPKSFTVTYTAKDRGKSLVQAWRDGRLPLELDANLPQIGVTA